MNHTSFCYPRALFRFDIPESNLDCTFENVLTSEVESGDAFRAFKG
jgi:hypothetical protein